MECEAGCGHEAEMRVWTETWAMEEGMILNLCLDYANGFFKARYMQECRELDIPCDPDDAVTVCCPNCEVFHVLPPVEAWRPARPEWEAYKRAGSRP